MHFSPYMGKKGWRFKRPPTNAIFLLSLILPVAKKHSFRVGKHSKRKEISSANKTPSTSNLNAQLVSGHFCSHRSTVEKYPWEISPSFLPFPYLWVSLLILCFQKVLVSFTAEWTKESPSNALPWAQRTPAAMDTMVPKHFLSFPISLLFHGSISLLATKSPVCFDHQNLAENHPGTRPWAGRVHLFLDYFGHVFSFLPLVHNCSWEGSVWSLCNL